MKLKVTMTSGDVIEARVTPRVEVDWESHFGKAFGATFAGGAKRQEFYYLAWLAAKHSGVVVKVFDGFIDDLSRVDVSYEDDEGPKAETPPQG